MKLSTCFPILACL